MAASISNLAEQVRKARERKAVTRADIVRLLGIEEGDIDKLESGEKLPGRDAVESICKYLGVGEKHWRPLLSTQSAKRKKFEETLEELVGVALTLDHLDNAAAHAADRILDELMGGSATATQTLALLNRLLTFYGADPMFRPFFEYYLTPRAFSSEQRLTEAVRRYQVDAIRLFSSFAQAYAALNGAPDLESHRRVLEPRPDDEFRARRPWSAISLIDEERLPDLGYISASAIRKERDERSALSQFLIEVAGKIEQSGPSALAEISQEKLRRMDSLLRKFSSTIPHGFLSPLFAPDGDALRREADRLGPKEERDLSRMERTQAEALENLANYLTADYMDVYVATSMRTNADFVSVNRFVTSLFAHPDV
ncbi:MAG TPA: helix-turn-helix transcriptional regulator, partial [Thermoanaerobaculia bacterium]|nr:helix-turn-helix transcriptional regulator [Thermoanaerobaculia bacterium]